MTALLDMARVIDARDFLLDGELIDVRLAGAVLSAEVERTMEGSSTVTLGVHDPEHWLIRKSGLLGKDKLTSGVRLDVDGLRFVLAEVQKTDRGVELVFYDEAIWKLKQRTGARKANRAKVTRAQFIEMLCKEAGVRFISPDKNDPQPVADGAQVGEGDTAANGRDSAAGGVSRYDRIYPAHFIDQAAGRTRLSAATVGKIAEAAGLPGLAFQQIARGESGYYPGVVQRDPGDGMVGHGLWQMTPNAWGSGSVLHRKMAALGGLAAMRNPVKAAQMAKIMYDDSGLSPWYGTQYLTAEGRAGADAARGGAPGSSGVDRTYTLKYEFRRGANESSWAAMTRLAEEVGWRCFAVGGTVYFASDPTLIKSRPRLAVVEGAKGIDRITWVWTTGRKIDEAELTVRSIDWPALPGSVVTIEREGPADGRWLVRSVRRNLLDPTASAEVTLGQPVKPKLEPANRTKTVEATSGEDGAAVSVSGSGGAYKAIGRNWSPKAVIDRIVLPLSNQSGVPRSVAQNDASNASHGPTNTGNTSDHQGPPSVRWAADMSNGGSPTPQMDKLARALAAAFNIPWSGAGEVKHTEGGFRFQMIYRSNIGGNHFNHVHFGVAKA